jgi:hypothetical protein
MYTQVPYPASNLSLQSIINLISLTYLSNSYFSNQVNPAHAAIYAKPRPTKRAYLIDTFNTQILHFPQPFYPTSVKIVSVTFPWFAMM